jgi:hypothetical protein
MPYVTPEARARLAGCGAVPQNAGELNYMLSLQVGNYLRAHGLDYQHLNDAIGALEGAKLELYRRVAAPYEDKKIERNGDVY